MFDSKTKNINILILVPTYQILSWLTLAGNPADLLHHHDHQQEQHQPDQDQHRDRRHRDELLLPLVVLNALEGDTLLLALKEALEGEAVHLHAEQLVQLVLCQVLGVYKLEQACPESCINTRNSSATFLLLTH